MPTGRSYRRRTRPIERTAKPPLIGIPVGRQGHGMFGWVETWHLDPRTYLEVAVDSKVFDYSQVPQEMQERAYFSDFRTGDRVGERRRCSGRPAEAV